MTPTTSENRPSRDPIELDERTAPDDPLVLFRAWLERALEVEAMDGTPMTLATADAAGRPSARMVLLKGYDERGFVFYTHYGSRKGRELAAHPHAALLLWWPRLHRQVRIEGEVGRISAAESDAYFASRPRGARLGASVSPQSEPIESRAVLERAVAALDRTLEGRDVPRPVEWGGFRLRPETIEFWLGREDRLHDRVRYTLSAPSWRRERLAP